MRPPPSCGAGPDGKGPCLAREGMHVRVPGSMPLGEAEGACDCVSKQASRPRSPNLTGELNHLLVVAAFIERTPAVAVGGRPAGRTDALSAQLRSHHCAAARAGSRHAACVWNRSRHMLLPPNVPGTCARLSAPACARQSPVLFFLFFLSFLIKKQSRRRRRPSEERIERTLIVPVVEHPGSRIHGATCEAGKPSSLLQHARRVMTGRSVPNLG